MNVDKYHALSMRETDVQGALRRMCGSEELFEQCLKEYLVDDTVAKLNDSITTLSWDDAFTAAHALKGVAGNMGFVPLMHNTAQLIILIRRGSMKEIPQSLERVNSAHRDIVDGIHQYFDSTKAIKKGEAI